MSSTIIPELDASARRFNIRMNEGDKPRFIWLVPGLSAYAGTYAFRVRVGDDVFLLDNTVIAQGDDALFSVVDDAVPELVATNSGYPWEIEHISQGQTRFGGLLFVEPEIA